MNNSEKCKLALDTLLEEIENLKKSAITALENDAPFKAAAYVDKICDFQCLREELPLLVNYFKDLEDNIETN